MYIKFKRIVFVFIIANLIVLFEFCSTKKEIKSETVIKTNNIVYWDNLATYLAGLPIDENNAYFPLTKGTYYKSYIRSIDKAWKKIEKNYILHVSEWSKEYLPKDNESNTAVYPLSGADFINLYHFYPNSPRYIMIGLETPGYVNDPALFKPEELKLAFYTLEASVSQIAGQNYFTTILMAKKFSNKYFPGVAPVLLVFLKRLGHTIDDLERISISPDGSIHTISEAEVNDNPEAYQGIRIVFHSEENGVERELIFLKFFVNHNSMDVNTVEGKYLLKQPRLNLVLKSAIYLLHLGKYKDFIHTILKKTDMVVEDDSGIPIRYFSKDEWDIQVFGKYTRRISIRYVPKEANMFKSEKGNVKTESQKFTQDDLKKIYETSAKPLLFKYGYGGASRTAARNNLILLRRHTLLKSKS
ncbi:MAG: hypothetical protein IPL26_08300 [Leptospiraceae bacterium]|nr:hypothetical protein [Leptospiraceae bacterium]